MCFYVLWEFSVLFTASLSAGASVWAAPLNGYESYALPLWAPRYCSAPLATAATRTCASRTRHACNDFTRVCNARQRRLLTHQQCGTLQRLFSRFDTFWKRYVCKYEWLLVHEFVQVFWCSLLFPGLIWEIYSNLPHCPLRRCLLSWPVSWQLALRCTAYRNG